MDAVPVEVVIEATSACADRPRAEAALAAALAGARAPKHAPRLGGGWRTWSVLVRIDDPSAGSRSGTATILDDRGEVVAERTLGDRGAPACTPLARAAAAWASLVLDDEMTRAHDPSPEPAAVSSPSSTAPAEPLISPTEDRDGVPSPPRRGRTVEIGALGFLRDGLTRTSGFAGVAPFVNVEVAPGWFVRPSFAIGRSTDRVRVDVARLEALTQLGARVDFCRRAPGNYIERRGLELDLCAGADLSYVADAIRTGVGPAGAFRGELGTNASLELRAGAGYNLVRGPIEREDRAPALFASVELGVSWRLR